jgi:hypothetical protein
MELFLLGIGAGASIVNVLWFWWVISQRNDS